MCIYIYVNVHVGQYKYHFETLSTNGLFYDCGVCGDLV